MEYRLNQSKFSNTRRKIIKASASSLILPTASFAAGEARQQHKYGILGQKAPELEVPTWIDGKGKPTSFKLADHKGKFVYMKLWQYWCPGCHSHGLPSLVKIKNAFKDNPNFTALSIQTVFEGGYINTKSKMDNIQKRYELYDIVMGHETGGDDPQGRPSTMTNYRTGGTPWGVMIDPNGKVIFNDFNINAEAAIDYLKKEIDKMS
jgi:thiol-disulfide isomerase/thioredoxin